MNDKRFIFCHVREVRNSERLEKQLKQIKAILLYHFEGKKPSEDEQWWQGDMPESESE